MPAFYPEGDDPKIGDAPNRSLQKINSLLKSIDTKTGSTTITGPVTVSNEVEVTNSTGNPIPVSGTVVLDSTSLAALENISVTFPATQNVNVTNAGLSVSVSNLPATQPVSGSVSVSNLPATQPTRETQPISDYVVNTSAVAAFSASGSALQSASFDAGANADYVVFSITGGGSSGALYYDLSTNNSTWDAGTGGSFSTYYDLPATSAADAYSYKSVASSALFGSARTAFSGRFIVSLTQPQPFSGIVTTYRYIRLNLPASNGGWRYRFASYKSVDSLISTSIPGNPSTARVTGRLDIGYISNLPALPTGTNTIGSVNVIGGNATAVKVDGSAVTQPVSLASAPVTPVSDNGGSLTVDGTVTVNDMTSGNAKTKVVDSVGADVSYITSGAAGDPSPNVVTVQGIIGGTGLNTIPDVPSIGQGIQYFTDNIGGTIPTSFSPSQVGDGIQSYLDNYGNNIPVYDASAANLSVAVGSQVDSAATTDTNNFSIIAFIKRGLQNWTTLLARIPALVSGRIPVDGSGVTQPISGTVTVTQSTNANLKGQAQILNSSGTLITYAESGTYGNPSVDVISVQNPQGTASSISTFTSTTPSTSLVSSTTSRKFLTVYNSGSGDLYISPTATCTTTNFQVKLASGDYWECPTQQVTLAHTAVYGSAGTAYITTIT